MEVGPFYFKSYDRTVGIANNTEELLNELRRLSTEDPRCVAWHLSQGHIVQWLSFKEPELASKLEGISEPEVAIGIIEEWLHRTTIPRKAGKSGRKSRQQSSRRKHARASKRRSSKRK
jgi:hypothetical protein